jgi:hypothetical protein
MPSPIEVKFSDVAAKEGAWWPELALEPEYPVPEVTGPAGYPVRIDFAVPRYQFGIELDGMMGHSSPDDIAKDRRRQRRLEQRGWTLIRFGGKEVLADPGKCVHEARAALSSRVADIASDRDRIWFLEHPEYTIRRRKIIPAEFGPLVMKRQHPHAHVIVHKNSFGRVRESVGFIASPVPDDFWEPRPPAELPQPWCEATMPESYPAQPAPAFRRKRE